MTDKGKNVLALLKKVSLESFSAASLSDVVGEKIAAATLTSLAKEGYLTRLDTKPVTYTFDKEFIKLVEFTSEETKSATNSGLRKAAKGKNDEFYTRREDIEAELCNYKKYFRDKVVFCNCDDPKESEFWLYFQRQFGYLGLKKLIATHYVKTGHSYMLEYSGEVDEDGQALESAIIQTPLEGDGDFRSKECIEILKRADIVVTNPPFSLFREYVAQLVEYDKKFLIMGNINAVTYKEIFKLIKEDKIWAGTNFNKTMEFIMPDSYELKGKAYIDEKGRKHGFVPGIAWYTNLPTKNRSEEISTAARYYDENHKQEDYSNYDNYNAINVNKVIDIPMDYEGYMGVPITFIDKYNPDQFELLGIMNTGEENPGIRYPNTPHGRPVVNGEEKYLRILIKNRHPRKKKERK